MSYRFVVRPEVDADLQKAEAWYEQQQPGLGNDFLRVMRKAMSRLPRNPLLHRIRHRRLKVRWFYPRRFPYRIIFRVAGDEVIIYAVIHAARHDQEWRKRL